jgi:hypothetical protein
MPMPSVASTISTGKFKAAIPFALNEIDAQRQGDSGGGEDQDLHRARELVHHERAVHGHAGGGENGQHQRDDETGRWKGR